MSKISLEELKARSIDCGSYPRLVEIARMCKSPTAAFDLAGGSISLKMTLLLAATSL